MSESIDTVGFGVLSPEDIIKLSAVEIDTPHTRGTTNKDGTVYDERMGTISNGVVCMTCHEDNKVCPGHIGHVLLEEPVYNFRFTNVVAKIIGCICIECSHLRIQEETLGPLSLVALLDKCSKMALCPYCDEPLPTIKYDKPNIFLIYSEKDQRIKLSARQALNILSRISKESTKLLGFNKALSSDPYYLRPDGTHIHEIELSSLIFTVLPVLPPCARPWVVKDRDKKDDDLTEKYNQIVKINDQLKHQRGGDINTNSNTRKRRYKPISDVEKQKLISDLQTAVNIQIDVKSEKVTNGNKANARDHTSLSTRLNKKEGRIQQDIGGKRGDYTARGVVDGGGISLMPWQFGVSPYVSKRQTKPFTVFDRNIEYWQRVVNSGGALSVTRRGRNIRLDIATRNFTRDYSLHVGDIVNRYLQTGDDIVINRQPSLRIVSMQGSKAIVMPNTQGGDVGPNRLSETVTTGLNADQSGQQQGA